MSKVLILSNSDSGLFQFRGELIRTLANNYRVVCCTPDEDGYIDKSFDLETGKHEPVRYSKYLSEDKVKEHLEKLNKYYKVDLYYGKYNKINNVLNYSIPKNTKIIRIFPKNKINMNDEMDYCLLGYLKDNKYDEFVEQDLLDKRILDKIVEYAKCSMKDIQFITEKGLEKVLN